LVSLPNRYMHSPVELISLRDLEQIPELLAAFALSLRPEDQFKVTI
jgi:endoglucanase